MNCHCFKGIYREQAIPSILPNNIVLEGEEGWSFEGIYPGHIFAHFPEHRKLELEEAGVFLVGRQASLNYERVDETIMRWRDKL
jgi:hypothetical protein